MFSRRSLPALFAIIALAGLVHAEDRVQSELKFVGHNKAEKTAGVWMDGQYVGFVKELTGDKKIVLLPGKHDVIVRQAWYDDFTQQVILGARTNQRDQRHPGEGCASPGPVSNRGTEDRRHADAGGSFCGQPVCRPRG